MNIKKMCSFYVNDWHLTTMILPYVSKLIEEDTQVETVFERGIENNVKELISKLNMNPDMKRKILDINWNITENENIKEYDKKRVILVNGTKEKIEQVNDLLENEITTKENTTIINCYNAGEIEENIQDILQKHHNMINTSGEHNISEVIKFEEK